MITWGINALNHDASICVFKDRNIIWHKRSSEFTGISSDPYLNISMIDQAKKLGLPERIYWYENPFLKKLRQLRAGQYSLAFDLNELPSIYLKNLNLNCPISYSSHHLSHAAAGYYTSSFVNATIVVVDAIGEFETMSIWSGKGRQLTKLWSNSYPNSIGLFYSAFTQLIGLEPTKQEHILMNMSLKGNPDRYYKKVSEYFKKPTHLKFNLHKGIDDWNLKINDDSDKYDIAAAVQRVFEEQMNCIMYTALKLNNSENLVFMGGCAYNQLYNQKLINIWHRIYDFPHPGDAGSSIGAVLAFTKMHTKYLDNSTKK